VKAFEEINALVQAHRLHATEPTLVSPLSQSLDMAFPGVVVVGDSVDVFNREPPGAPMDALACHSVKNVSAFVNDILATRRPTGEQTVVMVVRADNAQLRRTLAEDLAARVHLKYAFNDEEPGPNAGLQ
jgi:hypothetical protein